MSAVLTAAAALLRSRDRATSALTVAAFALPHALLLAVTGGVMAFMSRSDAATATGLADDPTTIEGATVMYVPLAFFAATLLVVPSSRRPDAPSVDAPGAVGVHRRPTGLRR